MQRISAFLVTLAIGIGGGYLFASHQAEQRLHTVNFANGCQRLAVTANVLQNLPADARPQTRRLLELELRQAIADTSRGIARADKSVVSVLRSRATSDALAAAKAFASAKDDTRLLREIESLTRELEKRG